MIKLFSAFRTDPWAQRDPERRAIAVRDGQSPELLAALPGIAAQDADPGVRRAALSRIADPVLLRSRTKDDADGDTRAVALSRLSRLLVDPEGGLSADARMAAIAAEPAGELLERIAATAPDVAARQAALARIERPGFLQRRCVEETDADLRATLLDRIDGEDTLDKLAEKLRRIDKTLSHRARERADSLRLARGEPTTVQRYADALCDTLTRWARALPDSVSADLDAAEREWAGHSSALPANAQAKVAAHFLRVRDAIAWRERPAPEIAIETATETIAPPEIELDTAPVQDSLVPAQIVAPMDDPPPDWSAFDLALADARRAAGDKQLGEARTALKRVRDALKNLPRMDHARRERLSETEAEVTHIDRWQRWSGQHVRVRLCEDLEALISAGHHPDGVATRVRELQQEWTRLDAAEQGGADRDSGLTRRFRSLCARAMAPTKPYFEQRHALREQHREGIDSLLTEATPEALSALDIATMAGLRRRLVEALRNLDQIEPKARTAMAQRLREALTASDARLDALREDATLARTRLIARLRRDLTGAAPEDALALAKQAQSTWKTLPRPGREQEADLQRELATLIDPIFANQRARHERDAEAAEQRATESRRILDELAALADGDSEALTHVDGRIAALESSWKTLHRAADSDDTTAANARRPRKPADHAGQRDRDRDRGRPAPRRETSQEDRAFEQAVDRVRRAQASQRSARLHTRLSALIDAANLMARLEAAALPSDAALTEWDALLLDDADRRRLSARWQQAQEGSAARHPDNDHAADLLLVEAEMDAGLDSPTSANALRRERQMQRLANRLQGGDTQTADPLAHALAWALLPPGDVSARAEREVRMQGLLGVWKKGG